MNFQGVSQEPLAVPHNSSENSESGEDLGTEVRERRGLVKALQEVGLSWFPPLPGNHLLLQQNLFWIHLEEGLYSAVRSREDLWLGSYSSSNFLWSLHSLMKASLRFPPQKQKWHDAVVMANRDQGNTWACEQGSCETCSISPSLLLPAPKSSIGKLTLLR